jgi:hypothetical protein
MRPQRVNQGAECYLTGRNKKRHQRVHGATAAVRSDDRSRHGYLHRWFLIRGALA